MKDKSNYSSRWGIKKLGDVAELNPKTAKDILLDDLEVDFIPMRLVEEKTGEIAEPEKRKFHSVKQGYVSFANNDILFAKVTPCMENGKIAIVNNLNNNIGFGSSEFHVIRVSEQILNSFLFYFLIRDKFRSEAAANMTGAVGLRRVPKQFLENYRLPVPPLSEQNQIVDKIEELFSELDAGRRQLESVKDLLKTYRQAVLKYAFEGRFTNGNVEKGQLASEWRWISFGKMTNNYDGKRIPLSRHIRANRKGEFNYYGATGVVDQVDDYIFDGKYILIGEDGANLLSKSRALAFIVTGKFWVNNHAHVVQCKPEFDIEYLCHYFNSLELSHYITGSAQPKLTQAKLNSIPVCVPSLLEQEHIVRKIESRLSECDKIKETAIFSMKQIEVLKQSILKQAFEGKLVKPQTT